MLILAGAFFQKTIYPDHCLTAWPYSYSLLIDRNLTVPFKKNLVTLKSPNYHIDCLLQDQMLHIW